MSRQVKAEEKRLDKTLLHDNLVEVCEHVIDVCKCRHRHFEANRLGDVDDRHVNRIRPSQVGSFASFVAATER